MEGEFHDDWELLHDSSESGSVNSSPDFDGIEADSEGMIRTDYFSLDSQIKLNSSIVTASDESDVSNHPSWVDPEPETRYSRRELWPDSGSDRSDDGKFGEIDAKGDLGFSGDDKTLVGFEGIGGIGSRDEFSMARLASYDQGIVGYSKKQVGFEGINSGPLESKRVEGSCVISHDGKEISAGDGNRSTEIDIVKSSGGEGEEKKRIVWWKVPFELLRFCALRVNPVWTFSVAAAVMGVVMLSRRLYKMKKKSQALHLKVAMDDKKVSQFMTRAARLNEAFSVVKRVPVIRPSLPAAGGLSQWPMMSIR